MRSASPQTGQAGFALVAALAAVSLFALFAYAILAANRGEAASVGAQIERAKLEAAVDGGLATVIARLGARGVDRWPIDGESRAFALDEAEITAAVEDERGKAPLNRLSPDQARRLFQAAGVSGPRLAQLTDSFLNWEDGGERANGAKTLDYAAQGVKPRGGPFETLGELMALKGMDEDIFARLEPIVTVFPEDLDRFNPATASPAVLKIMTVDGDKSPDAVARMRQQAGEHAAFDASATIAIGNPVTIRIVARDAQGGVFRRVTVVELTGQHNPSFWIRSVE